VATIQIIDPMN